MSHHRSFGKLLSAGSLPLIGAKFRYYEAADSNDERVYLGTVNADIMSQALDLAAQYFEYPTHDLVAVQVK